MSLAENPRSNQWDIHLLHPFCNTESKENYASLGVKPGRSINKNNNNSNNVLLLQMIHNSYADQ